MKYKTIDLVQGSAEWLTFRKSKIGASDSLSIMNTAPSSWNKNPYTLWESKQSKTHVDFMNENMKRGKELEPYALRAFEIETGYLMTPIVALCLENEFMLASMDGVEIDENVGIEIKCPREKSHEIALHGKIPQHYIPQMQHQMSVLGLEMMYFFSYCPEHEEPTATLKVYRDEEYIKTLIEKESHFYHHHMLKNIAPENIPQIKKIDSQNWKSLVDEYKKLDAQSKEFELRKNEIKDLLVQISNSENASGHGISLQRIERKGIIPYSSIPQIKDMDLESFRKPSTFSWRISE